MSAFELHLEDHEVMRRRDGLIREAALLLPTMNTVLSAPVFLLLLALEMHPRRALNETRALLDLPVATMNALVKTCTKLGFLSVLRNRADHRQMILVLTPKAHRFLRSARGRRPAEGDEDGSS